MSEEPPTSIEAADNDDVLFDQTAWSALEIGLPVDEMRSMKRFNCEGLRFKPAGHVDLESVNI